MCWLVAGLIATMAVAAAGDGKTAGSPVGAPAAAAEAPQGASGAAPVAAAAEKTNPGSFKDQPSTAGDPRTASSSRGGPASPPGAASAPASLPGVKSAPPSAAPAKYLLRYKFQPGQTLRWEVVHRARVETAIAGVSQTVETYSKSIKVWRVRAVAPDGTATFENSVEHVEMRQRSSGRMERHYNSQTDKNPPPEFQDVAQSVGVPLWAITLDPRGRIVKRQILKARPGTETQGQITVPLPEDPVAVGHTWTVPLEVELAGNDGTVKKVKIQQSFTLESVEGTVATIRVASQVLTPLRDPAQEALLVQREPSGRVRFDIEAGRVLEEQMDVDKEVVGFAGKASTLHYRTRLTEKYLGPPEADPSGAEATASRSATDSPPAAAKR